MESKPALRKSFLSAALLLAWMSQPAWADEVHWRFDYDAARSEAKEKQRPILLDFGTTDCVFCRKLDATTFNDAAIARQLNEQFIPVKVDAEKEVRLTKALQIESFPTLVFATAGGKILSIHTGFLDTRSFQQEVQKVLGEPAPTVQQPVARAPASASVAESTLSRSDLALRLTAPPAAPVSMDRNQEARDLLGTAREDLRQGRLLCCLERCARLISSSPDLPEADEARRIQAQLKGEPALARQLAQQLSDQLAELLLTQADRAIRANDPAAAAVCLERVAQVTAGSPAAQLALERLDKLRGTYPPKTIRGQSP